MAIRFQKIKTNIEVFQLVNDRAQEAKCEEMIHSSNVILPHTAAYVLQRNPQIISG